jgi:hypothetical protein
MILKLCISILFFFVALFVNGQDTLKMFFQKLPKDLLNSVRLIDLKEKKDYPSITLTYEHNTFIFESETNYVGIALIEIKEEISTGFYPIANDTFAINDKKLIIFENPNPKIYFGVERSYSLLNLDSPNNEIESEKVTHNILSAYSYYNSENNYRRCIMIKPEHYYFVEFIDGVFNFTFINFKENYVETIDKSNQKVKYQLIKK